MITERKRERVETEVIVVGYAMSRLDNKYLEYRKLKQWSQAYREASELLIAPRQNFKNIRDEFDPVHSNARQGWHKRPLRPNRQKVLDELRDLSDDAVIEFVSRILKRDEQAIAEAVDSLATVTKVAHNVAERLLTGKRAEEYFLQHSKHIVGIETADIIDMRLSAQGFDFGVQGQPNWAIEVKGLKQMKGGIQFTDREWREAGRRRSDYWLAVIGNLAGDPAPSVFRNPYETLTANCTYQQTIVAVWNATVSVQSI